MRFTTELTAEGAASTFTGFFSSNTERASYQLEGSIQNLDVGRILDYGATTNLNMEFSLTGTGTDFQTMAGNLILNMAASEVVNSISHNDIANKCTPNVADILCKNLKKR